MTKAFIARQWARPERETSCCGKPGSADAFSSFLMKRREERLFTLSGMAFQDALSLDTERLRYCCIHIVRPDGAHHSVLRPEHDEFGRNSPVSGTPRRAGDEIGHARGAGLALIVLACFG